MHPTLMHEIARYSQVDLLREAERERLAPEVSTSSDEPQRPSRLWSRNMSVAFGRPVFSC